MAVRLSVVVVAYDMARELPRTLQSLVRAHGIELGDVELIVVDNGSRHPLEASTILSGGPEILWHRIEEASCSPVRAANAGIAAARGDLIGLIVDGARIASPGLLETAMCAARLARRSIVTAPAYHLGSLPHAQASDAGYDQSVEEGLLAECGWEEDGYQLFTVSTFAPSSARGWFGAMGESSSLFMPRELWDELGGLDERFSLPGGGLANHDLYRRACELPDSELIVMLGEGTFHQIHGGAATSGGLRRDEMLADYERITGRTHRPPNRSPRYFGRVRDQCLRHLARSVELAQARAGSDSSRFSIR